MAANAPIPIRQARQLGPYQAMGPTKVAYIIFNALVRAYEQGDTQAKDLIKNSGIDLAKINPWQISSILSLQHYFGDINSILNTANQAGTLPQDPSLHDRIRTELSYMQYAAGLAKLPKRELRFRNMVPIYDSKGNLEDIRIFSNDAFQRYLQTLNQQDRLRLQEINELGMNKLEQEKYNEIRRAGRRAQTFPHQQRTKAIEEVKRMLAVFEQALVERHIRDTIHYDKKIRSIRERSERIQTDLEKRLHKTRDNRERKRLQNELERIRLANAERDRILAEVALDEEGDPTVSQRPQLHLVSDKTPSTRSERLNWARETKVLKHSQAVKANGDIDIKGLKKKIGGGRPVLKGTAQALQYYAMLDDIEESVALHITQHFDRFQGESQHIKDKISRAVATEVAPDIAHLIQESLNAQQGIRGANNLSHLLDDRYAKDPNFRTRIAVAISKALATYDPTFAPNATTDVCKNRVRAYLDASIQGLQTRADNIPIENVKLSVKRAIDIRRIAKRQWPVHQKVLQLKKVVQIPDDGHLVRGVTRAAVGPSLLDAAREAKKLAFRGKLADRADRFNETFFGSEIDPNKRQSQMAKQITYSTAALDALEQSKKNPLALAPLIPWYYAPKSLRESAIGTRAALIGILGWPVAGPLAAAAGLKHAGLVLDKEIANKYILPWLQTDEFLKVYSEGFAKAVIGMLLPYASEDKKGRVAIGLPMIPQAWDMFVTRLGQGVLEAYDRNYLALDPQKALKYSNSLGGQVAKRIGHRWYKSDKRRDPISIFIFGPIWEIAKATTLKALESTGYLPGIRTLIKGNELGYLSEAWKYGGGWADIGTLNGLKNLELKALFEAEKPLSDFTTIARGEENLWFRTEMSDELKAYFGKVNAIENKFNNLNKLGNVIKGLSSFWHIGKAGIEGFLRGLAVYGISFLATGNPLAATALSFGYSVPWTIRKILTTPVIGGLFKWTKVGGQYVGSYVSTGLLSKIKFLGPLAKALNTPISQYANVELSRNFKIIGGISKLFPLDGIFFGMLLSSLGISPIAAYAIPISVDLGLKLLNELRGAASFQSFFGPMGVWSRITGAFGAVFNVGSLSFALEHGGFSGLFDVFKNFNIPNLMKFSTLPSTYLSMMGLFGAFGATTVLGMPAWIAAGVLTGGVILTDQLLRYFGVQHGLWTVFKAPLDAIWEFLKSKGFDFTAGVTSLVIGLFGLIKSLMKGDIQGISVSIVMLIVGGVLTFTSSASTFPSAYFKPTDTAGQNVHENKYIISAYKNKTDMNSDKTEISYQYRFTINEFIKNDISSITISERDIFTDAQKGEILEIEQTKTPDTIKDLNLEHTVDNQPNLIAQDETFSDASLNNQKLKIDRKFTITLSKPLDDLISDDEKFCNMMIININNVEENDGTSYKPLEPDITDEVCLDNEGNIVSSGIISSGGLREPPLDPTDSRVVGITGCFAQRGNHFHAAIDISAVAGTPVYSVADGVVYRKLRFTYRNERGTTSDGYGNYIIINHSYYHKKTTYAHLSDFGDDVLGDQKELEVGDKVSSGQIIGYVGQTGNSTGNHLHFETKDSIGKYNPCIEKALHLCDGTFKFTSRIRISQGLDKCTSTPKRVPYRD